MGADWLRTIEAYSFIGDLSDLSINQTLLTILNYRCRVGWWGSNCDVCHPYPGCQHGFCLDKPWECRCHPEWTGFLCDQSKYLTRSFKRKKTKKETEIRNVFLSLTFFLINTTARSKYSFIIHEFFNAQCQINFFFWKRNYILCRQYSLSQWRHLSRSGGKCSARQCFMHMSRRIHRPAVRGRDDARAWWY